MADKAARSTSASGSKSSKPMLFETAQSMERLARIVHSLHFCRE
jgi:hypothetical protein